MKFSNSNILTNAINVTAIFYLGANYDQHKLK